MSDTTEVRYSKARWLRAVVSGPSMLPVLDEGDSILVRRRGKVAPGDVVMARFRELPDVLVVKRAVEAAEGGWLLESENPAVAGHGVTRGIGDVEGVVAWRYRPWPPRRVG